MPSESRSLLKRQEVRKSPKKPLPRRASVQLEKQDAIHFLSELKEGSIDLLVSSPPYCMGKAYEKTISAEDFRAMHERLAPLLVRALKDGGSLCWQVGHHVQNGVVIPLDAVVYSIFSKQKEMLLRNRIVWTFAHGVHAARRFSGRHESILWFTKGSNYVFNLDSVRVPQKYPGKRHYKGPNKGKYSGNPRGKNPSDVWEIPNVKANHVEKTNHPCQFPVALVQRLIRALAPAGGLVCDPFLGSGSSAVAAMLERRRFLGCDLQGEYLKIAHDRIAEVRTGAPKYRPLEKEIYAPSGRDSVSRAPSHFRKPSGPD
jgi:adenine-specific DNA-methyltransferase